MKIIIEAVTKKEGVITALLTDKSYETKAEVIKAILSKKDTYYVGNTLVCVVNGSYLRTDANKISEDNLGNIREVSDISARIKILERKVLYIAECIEKIKRNL